MTTTNGWGDPSLPPMLIQCPRCDGHTLSTQQGAYTLGPQGDEDFEPLIYTLVSCDKCRTPQLLMQMAEMEAGGVWGWSEPVCEWPSSASGPLSPSIPSAIAREMREARACFSAKLYTATAVMVRRTLEGMCVDQGTSKKALFAALGELRDANKIEGRLFDWAQALRVLGNQGAHFSKEAVGREDAQDALELAEALLDYIYVFTAKYDEFQQRRAKASGG
ncbi:DUF4145 domain-containing protein [Streptomyces coelicoflavus]|uniref:DUF4145 domain-containing protein n=1 Tax=Streptomyces coelicoflavus TaxID=285562 RepID=UPI00225B0E9D|nr:DUF4145 domain-containing protein [Streptomyces coelicoflavus]MCX5035335.1 DUF4145 domain-containing protein [Streptomyces coelicoflavus]